MSNSKRAIKAEDFTKLEVFSDPRFSPDGSTYSYVSTTINDKKEYESHLFFQHVNDSEAQQWTFGDVKNSNPRFSPDGKQVVFQSNRSGLPQLWILHTDGGEARQLTTFKNGAGKPNWSKDGKHIIFSASLEADDDVHSQKEQSKEERQKEAEEKKKQPLIINRLKYKSDANGFHSNKRSQLVLFDMEKETFTQLTSDDTDHGYLDISPDGNLVLFAGNLNKDADYELISDLFLLNRTTKDITKLTNGEGAYHNASFSPNGDKIASFGHEYVYDGATLNELYIFDVKTKERTCLSEEWDIQLGDAMIGDIKLGQSTTGPIWAKDEKHLFFIATDFGATGLYQVTLDSDLKLLYKDDNHVFGFSYDPGAETFILGINTPTNPCNFYQLNSESELKRLTNANATFLDEVSIAEPETLTVTADDGWEIQGWLLRPYGFEEGKKYPFVLEVHGGPHAMYGQAFFHEMQLLAAKGYVVLYTNPRGSHGYGQQFVDAVRSDYGGKDFTDLMSAVDYVLENYSFIDENRLGVTGGSYGGFMTNWIVGHTNRFKAAVTQRSISNWLSFYGVSDIGYFFTKWELGKHLMEDPEKLWNFSPLKYAENVETPLLILHGEKDFRCPIEQGEQLFVTLKHLRKNVEFVRFPDASHELSRSGKPEMRIERLNHIGRWFEKYL
ncbi:acylaminoacyl-peptidase [Virgibacillus natechei]|uniref:Acylaminoacyl-peptidase n=1 Tax=Virgibacillus natechei TaxID=1216297 RepID=A0ABS4IJG0_9BACI|nr:S9 family peptidase [Virgibacillus natechei]MBP1970134.1 acylaminoacyl-peptidase [Virgibacillus natechei]UZD14208.1 S9 family peptidase [Virgibacillus natechei]